MRNEEQEKKTSVENQTEMMAENLFVPFSLLSASMLILLSYLGILKMRKF